MIENLFVIEIELYVNSSFLFCFCFVIESDKRDNECANSLTSLPPGLGLNSLKGKDALKGDTYSIIKD